MIRRWLPLALAAVLALGSCSPAPDSPSPGSITPAAGQPPEGAPPVDERAAELAGAISKLDVSALPMQSSAAEAQEELKLIYAGMDGIRPVVSVKEVSYRAEDRAADLTLAHSVDVGEEPWTFESKATLKWVNDQWRLEWSPTIVQPKLDANSRMRRIVEEPTRASINDKTGLALVEEITLYEVGIDKSQAKPEEWGPAAQQLATELDVDPAAFDKKVAAGGPKQFVVAATLRKEEIPATITDVPGLHVREISSTVGPTDGFAASLLGIVGAPTQEMIEKSGGKLTPQDTVGLSGLQSRYDAQLRGVPGVRIEVVPRKGAQKFEPQVIFQQDPSVGSPIQLSLDRDLQEKAEQLLATQTGVASIVAIEHATGAVAAAANSPASGTYPHATFGKYAPGSTFKLASALAMLREGMTADSKVQCTPEHKVANHTFNNYPGYANTGNISLADAIAYSCNTAFTRASADVTAEELLAAAGSLGVGVDYDAGFRSFFGTVEPKNDIDRAASMIGQGQVTMSPLAMATLTASVAKGETVIPWLVQGKQAKSTAAPLTEQEATELRKMMAAVVDHGTAQLLKGIALGAKSGTAQFGAQGQQRNHAWMIAYNETYAVAAFVEEGYSGGTDAGPLLRDLLS